MTKNDNGPTWEELRAAREQDYRIESAKKDRAQTNLYLRITAAVIIGIILLAATIVAGIAITTQQRNDRQHACVTSGGTWNEKNTTINLPEQCLHPKADKSFDDVFAPALQIAANAVNGAAA